MRVRTPSPFRPSTLLWITAPLLAAGFLFWLNSARLHRIDYVTNLVETDAVVDPASATGYAGGLRQLIVPEHNNESYQWLVQTQQMLARHEWRVRHVDYDNAPVGRTVLTPSPYRWWLGLVTGACHLVSGESRGLAVEQAARLADPVLHALLLLGAVVFVAWRFGGASAGLLAVALVTMVPLGGAFLPGQPGDDSLVLSCGVWAVLLLLAGVNPCEINPPPGEVPPQGAAATRWFVASAVAGGIGLWIDVARTLPLLAGIALGGGLVAWAARRTLPARSTVPIPALPWRSWGLGGACTCLAAYLLEYSPAHLGSIQLRELHPLYGLAWLGAGELLARLTSGGSPKPSARNWRPVAVVLTAVLALAAVPVALILTGTRDLFTADPAAIRLTHLNGSPAAQDLWAWIRRDGFTLTAVATLLPMALLLPAGWILLRRGTDLVTRSLLALAGCPALVALGFACFQLRGWNDLDALLLVLLVALTAATPRVFKARSGHWVGLLCCLLLLVPGALLLTNKAIADRHDAVTEGDVAALIERDLAHWLARQAGPEGAVILAPPNLAMSLIYHGGLPGLGTPFWQNKEGSIAAMRIAGASSPDEAQAITLARKVNFIVIPSWDNFLDEYARLGAVQEAHTLMASLHRWLPPRWLRPVPYHLPKVAGFEDQSVAIFKVVDVQDNVTALSYLAEYFAEMEQVDQARAVASALERSFPADLGASVARVLASKVAGDAPAFGRALDDIKASLARGDAENLTWDRRVSLSIALVEGRRFEQAREQARVCFAEVDEPRLRSLSTVTLHRLLVMGRGFGLKIGDPRLHTLAQHLLPAELRDQP